MKTQTGRDILKGSILPCDQDSSRAAYEKFFVYDKPSKLKYSGDGRWINHFCLGADPEFMFVHPDAGPVHATLCGLKAGLAFGADQNDRLVELRAAPYRDAVSVLASILGSLRWLYRYLGENHRTTEWHAPAFAHGDGMGGHVHFGRKRPQREDEVRGLDGLSRVMRACDLFDTAGWARRSKGDQFHQVYGAYGDIRAQKHGYEYRTLPTWLDSPRLAYLVLVLSKLVIVDPDITASWENNKFVGPWQLLQGLAKYYKGRDDDALILYSMMEHPSAFQYRGGDFRPRWGLTGKTEPLPKGMVIPAVIEPTPEDITDMTPYLTGSKALTMRECAPNFRDSIPSGYKWIPSLLEYRRRPNIGDIFYDMVGHAGHPVGWDFDNHGCQIFVPSVYDARLLTKIAGDIQIRNNSESNFMIRIGQEWRKGEQLAHLRRVLYSGLLPLWKAESVEDSSFKRWTETVTFISKKHKSKHLAALKGL